MELCTKVPMVVMMMLLGSVCIFTHADTPQIEITPESLNDTLFTGGYHSKILTISNTGDSDLLFDIHIDGQKHALLFDGYSGCVRVESDMSLNIQQSITLEAWFCAYDWYTNRRIIQKGEADNQYHILVHNGIFRLTIHFADGSFLDIPAPALPSINEWHHVAGVYDHSRGIGFLYLDSTVIAQSIGSGIIATNIDPLCIGTKYPGAPGGDHFNGLIDEVRVWASARDEKEIRYYMNHEITGSESCLAANWRFNEGTGLFTYDQSSNNNTGVLLGGTTWFDATAPILLWLSTDRDSGVIPPDSSVQIQVLFDAVSMPAGDDSLNIIITSNDPYTPEIIVPSYIHVVNAPDIAVSQDTLNFGVLMVGDSLIDTLVIYNFGTDSLDIADISIDHADYTLDTTSFILCPGMKQDVGITFKPSTQDFCLGTVTITSNDPYEPSYNVALIGAGLLGLSDDASTGPPFFAITDISPNPFSTQTTITYTHFSYEHVSLKIFDLTGRLVKSLVNEQSEPGFYITQWDGLDDSANAVSEGVYFLRYQAGLNCIHKKILHIR